jgi:hypothetical protein
MESPVTIGMAIARAQRADAGAGTLTLTPAAVARARALADAADAAMAARMAAPDAEVGMIELGVGAVLDKLRLDPQGMLDDNLGWMLLLLDALAYVTEGSAPTPRLLAYAPGLTS